MGERQRLQNDGFHGAEDGGRGADAQRERQHRDCGEGRVLDHLTDREGHVLEDFGQVFGSPHVSISQSADVTARVR